MSEKTCSMCSKKISLDDHPLGLVFDDQHFVCENCCSDHSEGEISIWTKNVMQSPEKGMPISLWLIHEQNKDKFFMTTKKI